MQLDPTHKEHLTPPSEIEDRHRRLRSAMADAGVDAVWIDTTVPLYYLAGSIQSATLMVPAEGAARYVVRKSIDRARVESPLDVEPFAGRGALYEAFAGLGGRLGLDLGTTSAADYLRISGALGDVEIVDVSGMMRGLRMVKSAWEVAQIRCATAISEVGFKTIQSVLAPGLTELEVSVAVETAMRHAGHQGYVRTANPLFEDFGTSIASGESALYPGNIPGSLGKPGLFPGSVGGAGHREIKAGVTVMADITGTYNGYTSDNTRVFLTGPEIPDLAAHAHDFCLEALRRVETLMVPGATCEQIFDGVDRWAEEAGKPEGYLGYGENQMKFIGHGVGIEMDEPPALARKIKTTIEPGMILAAEPKAFLPGIGPVGVENTYVITEDGCESLCGFDEGITKCP